ncbi:right-handed parallel beta-helix repeat-containing protein [Bythopirellula goksoeyrii]|uniref:Uncharacterized protein n=1 Tax=Bythopirellula goksoeyrii TaxID=1400387 RepID=A0A5B9Q420_9BACT|nr:right-handed parallel beta-helix repeat-containing protein [Bythopirellula goksoeyrii]QEG33764.1 hypothetical protein Pr1d_10340 [Bythopirellula goksoeyrii]
MTTQKSSVMLMLAVVAAVTLNTIAEAQHVSRGRPYAKITAQRGTIRGRVPGKIVIPPRQAPDINELPKRTEAEKLAAAKLREIRAPATSTSSQVLIDRNVTLSPNDVITKRLIFEGSKSTGVTLNLNGATLDGGKKGSVNYDKDMIEVRSEKVFRTRNGIRSHAWKRPENILVQGKGTIIGSIRVWGMGKNGEAADVKESSRRDATNSQHTQRARTNAPRNIVFDRITIIGVGRNPVYFAPGVTYSKLINSEVKGKSSRVGIYLDAESAYNTFENNYIHVETKEDNWGKIPGVTGRGWPQMAIDGSSRNTIHNNRFSSLSNGGIYLYRNCGEGGTIRLTPPENNTITNNTFYYKKYKGSKPAIYLGSRDYGRKESTFGHCNDDSGRPYGSSSSNKDYARHNIIKNNKLHKRMIVPLGGFGLVDARVEDMIVTKNKSANSPNETSGNTLYE